MLRMQLVFTVTFLLFTIITSAQSVREIEIENDDTSLYLKFEDGEVTSMKIDGKTIPSSQYSQYQDIIDKHINKNSESRADKIVREAKAKKRAYQKQREYDERHDVSRDENDDLAKAFEAILSEKDILFDKRKYNLRLTNDLLRVNGNRMPSSLKEQLDDVAFEITEVKPSDDYTIKIKVRKGSRSISVGIEN